MTTLEIWLTALALAADSFTVAIAAGLILKRIELHHFLFPDSARRVEYKGYFDQ